MKLSLKAMFLAGAFFAAVGFVVITLVNLLLPPFGGAFLVLLSSLYPGYDPVNWPIGIIVGSLYSLLAGGLSAWLLGLLYNLFCPRV
jgi:hypothetical protein